MSQYVVTMRWYVESDDLFEKKTEELNTEEKNKKIACAILKEALKAPAHQILINAGKDPEHVISLISSDTNNIGYDVKEEKMGDMYEMGVIDPLKVTKNALLNAVSVATTILSTNAIVTHARIKN